MERKVPPPRGFGGPPVAQQPFARRNGPPNAFVAPPAASASAQNAPPPPPQQPTAPQSFGFPAANASNRRNWRPGRVGGRHDSPLYGKHRKRPSSSSIDSNVSWSGSEIESVGGFGAAHSEQEQVSRLSWASSVAAREDAPAAAAPQQDLASAATLFRSPAAATEQTSSSGASAELETKQDIATAAVVQPPKTPLGRPTPDEDGAISAAQRVRMELSGSRAGSRANSSENVFVNNPPDYDEEKNGPQSCPSTFSNARQPQFSIDKLRQLRSKELVTSKLLPTRASVNSLMGYVRELQMSEASLRKQLVKTKQHTEEELTHSLSKVSELERSMQEVERDRELARRKLEEQEKLIRDLAAKLKQAESAKAKGSSASGVDELPPIAEETISQTEVTPLTTNGKQESESTGGSQPVPARPAQAHLPPTQQDQPPAPPIHPRQQNESNRSARFGLASPRSPNRPLWDPWASGGATPMKNLPPVFNIGSTGLDPMVGSSTSADRAHTTGSTSISAGDYELKSVLMSPRRVQENAGNDQQLEQNSSAVPTQEDFAPQYPAPVFNAGTMPSPSYPQQQEFMPSAIQNEANGVQNQDETPLMEFPSQTVPMLSVELTPLQAETSDNAVIANAAEWNDFQEKQEVHTPAAAYESQVANDNVTNEAIVPPHSTTNAEVLGVLLLQQAPIESAPPQNVAPPQNDDALISQPEQVPNPEIDNGSINKGSAPPLGTSAPPLVTSAPPLGTSAPPLGTSAPPLGTSAPPLGTSAPPLAPLPTSEANPAYPAPSSQKDVKPTSAEPVSLETLLVDFFTEVDKKRLKMATAYGKRYAGREKWLFAELTKRYGAAKVSALKTRFEGGSKGSVASTSTASNNNGDAAAEAAVDSHATKVQATSDHPKAGRHGHPRHPQFFHPPAPASSVDLSAGGVSSVPPPLTIPEPADVSGLQTEVTGESGKVSPGRAARVSPRQRRSGGNIPPYAGPPPSFPPPHEATEDSSLAPTAARADGPPSMTGQASPIQREEPMSQFNQPPPPPPGRMEGINAAPSGLRQRHNAPGPDVASRKHAGAEAPVVSLEGLLKDLYQKHQPDKLKNVAIVAKQYAGKERELVGLLKGKYGALSVKQLEENLEVLERAHRARTGGKGNGKRRGCFIRTISLMFWLSVVLYFSFGAAFVSLVALDAWECRAVDSDEQELESSEECVPLKKELEAFTYERVCDYASQSHPDACFCSEWKARESALFTNLSGADFVNLARLVPFSPDAFGDAWIATVKEQIPSQEFYDGYAKPVVDVSLDVGSFVWFSGLDLVGYNDVSGEESLVVSEAENSETLDFTLLDEESASGVVTGSQERAAEEEEEIEINLSEENVDELQSENAEADSSAVAADAPEPEQALMEEVSEKVSGEVEVEDLGAEVNEHTLGDDFPVAKELVTSAAEESNDVLLEVETEDHATLGEWTEESVAAEEPEPIATIEDEPTSATEAEVKEIMEPESIVTSDDEPNFAVETEAEVKEEALFENDFVDTEVEHVESVRDENEGLLTSYLEADDSVEVNVFEEANIIGASNEVLKSVEEDASEVGIAASTDEKRGVELDGVEEVVEVEVRQDGLDLSYPEKATEVGSDVMEETQDSAAAEVPAEFTSSMLNDISESALSDDEVSASSSETESIGADVEASDDVAIDDLDVKSESEVNSVEEDVSMFIETDIGTVESEPDLNVPTEGSEERIDESSVGPADGEVETSLVENASSEDSDSVDEPVFEDHESEALAATDLGMELLESESVEEMAADLMSEESEVEEVEEVEIEANASSDVETKKEVQSEEEVPEEEGALADVHEIESSTTEAVETELIFASNEADVVGNLLEESVEEDAVVTDEDETNSDEEEELSNDAEVEGSLSDEVDVHSNEEDIEEEAVNDGDESVVLNETEANAAELASEEEGLTDALSEQSLEPTQDIKIKAQELQESDDEAVGAPVDVEATEETDDEADAQIDELEALLDIEVEHSEESVKEETEVGNEEAEATTRSEVEVEQPDSEDGVVSELGVEFVATEVTEVSDETGYVAVDSSELDGDVEDVKSIGAPSTDGEEEVAAAADEEAVVADDEGTNDNEEETLSDYAVETPRDAVVDDELTAEETEAFPVADDVPAPVVDEEAVGDADEVLVSIDVADAEESSNTDEPNVIENEATAAQQVMGEVPVSEAESGGLVSAVNEVLARLVEPFEAAKTAMPEVVTEPEYVADEL